MKYRSKAALQDFSFSQVLPWCLVPRWKLLELGGWCRNLPRLSGRGCSPSIRKSMEPSIPGPTFPIFFGTRRGPTGPWPLQAISGRGICYLRWFPGATTPAALSLRCTGAVGPLISALSVEEARGWPWGMVPLSAQSSSTPRRQNLLWCPLGGTGWLAWWLCDP